MRIFVVDAFADRPFTGNPAGVCLVDRPVTDDWMQSVAAEMKHAETAFLQPADDAVDYALRWFTPATEVELCGHATLASAHVLFQNGAGDVLRFDTLSGVLTVRRTTDGLITMDFPSLPAAEIDAAVVAELGIDMVWAGRSKVDMLVEVPDEAAVRAFQPDLAKQESVEQGVIVTAAADASTAADFVSRYFAPKIGIPEDPVTGAAHCVLAPYWAAKLGRSDGEVMTGAQLSARGGVVSVAIRGDRVDLAGRAVTVLEGSLNA